MKITAEKIIYVCVYAPVALLAFIIADLFFYILTAIYKISKKRLSKKTRSSKNVKYEFPSPERTLMGDFKADAR